MKKMLASAKSLVYGNRLVYFFISHLVIYSVAEKNIANTVNRKLGGGVHVTPCYNGILKYHAEQG